MSQDALNEMQRKIYQFIRTTYLKESRTPSREEIKKAIFRSTTSGLEHDLLVLQDAGYIELITGEKGKKTHHNIRLLGMRLPVEGYIAAGEPIESFIEPDQMINLGPELEDEGNYALIVRGNSMIREGFLDGDYVVIRRQNSCELGEVIVAVHLPEPSSATLKRFTREDGKVCLKPANGDTAPIYISTVEWHTEWQIQGIVLAVHRRYHQKPLRFVYQKEPY